jgi:DNA invertase Pin-like site-specific DNA recombinase
MLRIAIYSRKSVYREQSISIESQIELCKKYFEDKECYFEVFEDEGFSGGNTSRPSFQRMMNKIKSKLFDIVAVYKIDRMSRNLLDFWDTYSLISRQGVQFISISENINTTTTIGQMIMLQYAGMAALERDNIKQRVKDSMESLGRMGRWSGGTAPTGYHVIEVEQHGKKAKYLELDEASAPLIEKMFQLYSTGSTIYDISTTLSVPNKTILNILRNPVYCESDYMSAKYLELQGYSVYGEINGNGYLPYNRRPKKNGKKESKSKDQLVSVSKHKAIINSKLWIDVQEKLNEKANNPKPRISDKSFLAHLVKCKCGSGMFVYPGKAKKDGTVVVYFRCSAKKNGFECNSKFLRADFAEKKVLESLRNIELDKNLFNDSDTTKYDSQIKSLNKILSKNKKMIDNLLKRMALASDDIAKKILDNVEDLNSENKNVEFKLLELERLNLDSMNTKDNKEAFYSQVQSILNIFDSLPISEQQKMISTVIKNVVWDSDAKKIRLEIFEGI